MWKKFTKNYLKNNAIMSISIMITIFISALFISTICSIFYNVWADGIHRIKVEEGEWEGRLIGNFDSSVINEIKKEENIKEADLRRDKSGKEIISIIFKNPRTIYEDLPRIAQVDGIDLTGTIIEYHDTLLSEYLIFPSEAVLELPLVLPFFIIIMVLVCSSLVMIIYNAFGISMNSRIHQLGILQSVGATPKQICNVLMQEALALSAVPALLGIFGGILLNAAFIKFANIIGKTIHAAATQFIYSPIVFLMTLLICFLTVFWATYRAARRYSRIPLLNILKNGIEKPVKKIKKFRFFSMVFGIEGELTRKSIYSKRKSFLTAKISLTLSFVVFSVFLNFMALSDISTQQSYFERYKDTWDLMVSFDGEFGDDIQLLNEIREIPEVEECVSYQKATATTKINEEDLSDELKMLGVEALGETGIEKVGNDYLVEVPIIVLDDDSFKEYCKTIGVQDTYSSGNIPTSITINRIWDNINSNFRNRSFIPYIRAEEGRILNLKPVNGTNNIPVKVGAYSAELPNLREEYNYYSLIQIMSHSSFEMIRQDFDVSGYYKIMITPEGDFNKATNSLSDILTLKGYTYEIENRLEQAEYNQLARNGWNIVMGTLCLLFAIIGIANIFVNTLGDFYQREREYVRYMSVGLTHEGLKKMLLIEALSVCLKPIMIIVPIDLFFVIFANIAQYDGFIRAMPVKPIIILAFVIVLSTGLAYWILLRHIFMANILENIRNN